MRRLTPIAPSKQGGKADDDILTPSNTSLDTTTFGRTSSTRAVQACEPCRLLKVRCLSYPNSHIRKCQRCARLNQECVVKPRGPRKPRKRTDTRVAELEKKVEALRAAFGESSATGSKNPPTLTPDEGQASVHEEGPFVSATASLSQVDFEPPLSPCGISYGSSPQDTENLLKGASSDILTPAIAADLFDKYKTKVMQHFPLSLFADTEDASVVQREKPTLFLAAITAAAGDHDPELYSMLHDQLARDLAKRIIIDGERSIELVQALLLAAAFYHPPDAFEKHKYYQYIHMAWTMTTDIGLGSSAGLTTVSGPRKPRPRYDQDEIERNAGRRTLIASYMCCLSVGRSLRRPSMIQSDSAAEECIVALQKSSYVTPQDRQLIALARLELIMKDVTRLLGLSGLGSPADVADVRTQHMVKVFEDRFESWEKELSPELMCPFLEITYHYSKMYIHEIAFHHANNEEDFRTPFRLRAPSNASHTLPDLQPARLDCIIASLTSGHSLLDVLLRLPLQSLRVLPTVIYIRASYAIFILLKIFFISNAPGSKLGLVLPPMSVKVEDYLNRLVSHMKTATSHGNCSLTTRFCTVFSRSRDWFRKQALRTNGEKGAGDEDLSAPLRLLSLNDETDFPPTACRAQTPDLHQRDTARMHCLRSHTTNRIEKYDKQWSTATEPHQLDPNVLPYNREAGQYPMPWGSQNLPLDAVQAETSVSEPEFGSIHAEDHLQIPASEVDYTMDESFDLAVGFDFDLPPWDFELGDADFEQT